MPDVETRTKLVTHLLEKQGAPLTAKEIAKVVTLTEGYTCRCDLLCTFYNTGHYERGILRYIRTWELKSLD